MTREEFMRMLATTYRVAIDGPWTVVPCACRDVNCHGWRVVPQHETVRERESFFEIAARVAREGAQP
jgi:hypothetical protein